MRQDRILNKWYGRSSRFRKYNADCSGNAGGSCLGKKTKLEGPGDVLQAQERKNKIAMKDIKDERHLCHRCVLRFLVTVFLYGTVGRNLCPASLGFVLQPTYCIIL